MSSDGSASKPQSVKRTVVKKKKEDFRFGKTLGEGSYSTVVLGEEISTKQEYALKIISKRHIIKEKKQAQVMREKELLSLIDHPYFVKLYFTFQDVDDLYFGLSVARRGELLDLITHSKSFDFNSTQFYASQLVEALEYLHSLNILHRDLKPENILINDDLNIVITDFGTAKLISEETADEVTSSSFVGTAQYVSPEILKDKQACKGSDLWALGCIVYQMHCGKPPFTAPNEYLIFQEIVNCTYSFPDQFDSHIMDLVEKLLVSDPLERLGCKSCGGYTALKAHSVFDGIDWDSLQNLKAPDKIQSIANSSEYMGNKSDVTDLVKDFHQAVINDVVGNEDKDEINNEDLGNSSPDNIDGYGLEINLSKEDRQKWMNRQKNTNWHHFAQDKLILKSGILEKKRGLSVKVRQFLLMEGPRLVYVDPNSMTVKGEIPWSDNLSVEQKNFRIFYVHTPHRTYHLIDKSRNAGKWCKKIHKVSMHYFGNKKVR